MLNIGCVVRTDARFKCVSFNMCVTFGLCLCFILNAGNWCICICVACSCALEQSVLSKKKNFFFRFCFFVVACFFSRSSLSPSSSSVAIYVILDSVYNDMRSKCCGFPSLYMPYINPVFPANAHCWFSCRHRHLFHRFASIISRSSVFFSSCSFFFYVLHVCIRPICIFLRFYYVGCATATDFTCSYIFSSLATKKKKLNIQQQHQQHEYRLFSTEKRLLFIIA